MLKRKIKYVNSKAKFTPSLLQAPRELLVEYPIQNSTYGLHTTTVGLRFIVKKRHFDTDGDMKLKCTASIGNVYWRTNEKSVEGYKLK